VKQITSDIDTLREQEPEVLLRIAAAKLALLMEESAVKVDEYLKTINDGNELVQKIRAILRAYNAGRN
jgi:hypothetical protein